MHITIYTSTEYEPQILQDLKSVDRLEELVVINTSNDSSIIEDGSYLLVDDSKIRIPLLWDNSQPPILFPDDLPYSKELLLGLILHFLGNDEMAWSYLNESVIAHEIDLIKIIKHGLTPPPPSTTIDKYHIAHNTAVIGHYSPTASNVDHVNALYRNAIEIAPNDEVKAFTQRELGTFLIDQHKIQEAEIIILSAIEKAISDTATNALRMVLIKIWMENLTVPYDTVLLEKLKTLIWTTLKHHEKHNNQVDIGLLLIDATHIANISESYTEALGYIKRAIDIFDKEELPELAAHAQLKKGTLLYTWAQQDNPQFYKTAVNAYHEALKVYTKDSAPHVFADVHHNLGVLYSEMPSDNKKRGIWAGVATASFKEALDFYTKDRHPYQYGRICNSYGNALTKFPPAIHSDNYEKALYYYQESLDVRPPSYPSERSITLLNYIECSWNLSNPEETFNQERYEKMKSMIKEVIDLADDPRLIEEAKTHLNNIETLKAISHS